ncbi:TRAP transporter substrate-binding protein [Candidatus Atribacteria bacterium HGW-Atribacteria-1]|nr:MAG: TRAP transporter substrate-binding protein [Candidatus Atribacteria bacterium HGW-Atribacteria-1]
MLKKSIMIVLLILLIFSFSFYVKAEELKPITLTWVAGGVGGGWYVQAGGIASLINEKEPKITIKVVPGGGVVNPARVSKGDDDLGWGITFVDKMAFEGLAPMYKEAYPDFRALGGIFGVYNIHFLAAKDMGIKTVAEMAKMVKEGKEIKVAAPMKGTSDLPMVETILGFYGISLKDIETNRGKVFHAVYADMVTLYQDRHVDFVFTHLAIPAAAITEMTFRRDSTILSVSDECIDYCNEKLGTLSRETGLCVIPAGTYKGQEEDAPSIVSAGELIINKDVPNNVAYTITKILCENVEELHKINESNKFFIPEKGWKDVAVPLHPGAEMYYKEAGFME